MEGGSSRGHRYGVLDCSSIAARAHTDVAATPAKNAVARRSAMLGNCSWLWLRRYSLPYSLLATILTWFLVLTVGSFGHGAASSVHDGGNRPAASSWSATGGRKADEEEAYVQGRFAEVLANVPERDVPAYRALGRGIELYVRGSDNPCTMVSASWYPAILSIVGIVRENPV